jgi:hypothetical protein
MTDHKTAEEYCLARSRCLRARRADARWLIGLAVEQLPDQPPADFQSRRQEWKTRLRTRLSEEVRHQCGNPLIVWVLMNVIIPIVIKLVLEWWSNRRKATEAE